MATNVFDENFKNRLLAFQRDHGLPLDGKLDAEVWSKLSEQATTPSTEPSTEVTPEQSPEVTASTPPGSDGGGLAAALAKIDPANFPLLSKIATECQDEAGVRRFLLEEAGLDLDELARDVESVMAEEATV